MVFFNQDIAIVPPVIMVTLLAPSVQQGSIGIQLLKLAAASAGLALVLYLFLYHIIPKVLYARGVFPNRELTVLTAAARNLNLIDETGQVPACRMSGSEAG